MSDNSTTTGHAGFDPSSKGAIVVLGAGRAGVALSREIVSAGLPFAGLWNRSAMQRPDGLGEAEFESGSACAPDRWLEVSSLVILAVRDDVIDAVAARLQLRPGATVVHTSGALGSEALHSLPEGVFRGSYHPLQSFSGPNNSIAIPPYVVAIEGDPEALLHGQRLAQATGHRAVQLAGDQKAAYHAAAVLASNCMVALQAAASRVMTTTCGDRELAWELLWPLVMGTLAGLQEGRFESAITGPVVRGDIGSIERNLSALANDESALDLYRALGLEALEVARGAGFDDAELERIEGVLREG